MNSFIKFVCQSVTGSFATTRMFALVLVSLLIVHQFSSLRRGDFSRPEPLLDGDFVSPMTTMEMPTGDTAIRKNRSGEIIEKRETEILPLNRTGNKTKSNNIRGTSTSKETQQSAAAAVAGVSQPHGGDAVQKGVGLKAKTMTFGNNQGKNESAFRETNSSIEEMRQQAAEVGQNSVLGEVDHTGGGLLKSKVSSPLSSARNDAKVEIRGTNLHPPELPPDEALTLKDAVKEQQPELLGSSGKEVDAFFLLAPTYSAFWYDDAANTTMDSDKLVSRIPKAPWDPASTGRGHGVIQDACAAEIVAVGCRGVLPLDTCILQKQQQQQRVVLGASCDKVLNPCAPGRKNSVGCQQSNKFSTIFNETETTQIENLLSLIDLASTMNKSVGNLHYWMTAGSNIGTVVHHSAIPWDDDIDVYVKAEHMDSLLENLKTLGLGVGWTSAQGIDKRTIKVYNASLPRIPRNKHSYPFIDIFPVDCTTNATHCVEFNNPRKPSTPQKWIFPLKRRPFGRMSMPFPAQVRKVVEARYGSTFKDICYKGEYNHRKEHFSPRQKSKMNCSDLILTPAFASDQHDNNRTFQQKLPMEQYVPWPLDFPTLTVEYILNDRGVKLSAVLFDDGNEIRRSYHDGLIIDGAPSPRAITYNLPTLFGHEESLVPFLLEERKSFVRNIAGRSAEEINKEVLPILDRVVISNRFHYDAPEVAGHASTAKIDTRRLRIGEWNAERGLDWDVFPEFYKDADIIILNEMDIGMARSGNQDTTKQMATALQMNYAYGVEFLELTNGNSNEIKATTGQDNLVGYHGNVVLAKWPIIKSKVVRLHPLYDLLYKDKPTGQGQGERRLGGRMALFALVQLDQDNNILVISMHSHSGSKQHLLKQDADLVCSEIQRWNATNVLIGGDLATPIPQTLVSECGFFDLGKTNSQKRKGRGLEPTWRIHCPQGAAPRVARFPTRGDWILAKGSSFQIDSSSTKTSTLLPYRMHKTKGENDTAIHTKYECISDHALITLDVDFRNG